ncbi:AmmeMemoRadiSam system protein B, partial [Candidatus Pacearchaeota archaeon]|nr:AmmeMemoRadiSam system protein B [Candidatus Pacearchaeota archaeon]
MRNPVVAGSFYPSDQIQLEKELKELFLSRLGPGKITPVKKLAKRKDVKGIIAPHAGYLYSGACAAYAYKELAESSKPNLYIMLGTNHTGIGNADFIFSEEDFEIPTGIVRTEKWFVRKLKDKASSLSIETNEEAHAREHSIEVQIPFLQYINPGAKIVPLIVSTQNYESINKFARILANFSREQGKKILTIASSDFTHFGNMYNFFPFSQEIKKNLYKLDSEAIKLIEKFETNDFLNYTKKTTICGAGAIALCMEICKHLSSK